MNKQLLALIQPELTEAELRILCRAKKDELGFDIEKAIFPTNPLKIEGPKISLEDAIYLTERWDSLRDSVRDSLRDSVWEWASVGDSVWDSVGDSVWASVRDSVWASVRASVGDSVWASVGASLRASVRDSVGDSLWASVWDSVWDSVRAYNSSIFYSIEDWKYIPHEKGLNPFKPAIDLWNSGYIASYDGENWRLHIGEDAKIVWTGNFNKSESK